MPARFNILASDSSAIARLQQELDLPHLVAATLVARGITTPEQARHFLAPDLERDWLNPYTIPGLADVVDGLEAAIRANKRIVVFGDFDLDGISATALMTRALRELGAQVEPFIPNRNDEGYGLTEAAIARMRRQFDPECVVTVDCGISCREEVKLLRQSGIEVFITDHHEAGEHVPVDVPVVDPKLTPDCESAILAGVGVALKVVQALGGKLGKPHLWQQYTDLATLGTIADLMPMRDENRALVSDGVRRINEAPRPCIASLLDVAGAGGKPVAANSLSFTIIPRLNAAGRMGDAMVSLDLLLSDDFGEAAERAEALEEINNKRRTIEAELMEIASLQAAETYHGERCVVVAGEGWHEGVKGIVAGRLSQTYGVPAILFSIDETGEAHGSGRTAGQVNLFNAVSSVSDLLTRFGGHEAAVGITLDADKLPEFAQRLCAYMDTLPSECFHPRITIDACVKLEELTLPNAFKLEELMPFGQENEQPCFLARNVMLANCRAVGIDRNHLSCSLTDGVHSVSSIMFHCADIERLMDCTSVVNAAFSVQVDEWRGRKSVKAMLKALAPVRPCGALEACLDAEELEYLGDLYSATDAELCRDAKESAQEVEEHEAVRLANRAAWKQRAQSDPAGLREALVAAFIGEGSLRDAQARALDALDQGRSTLAVMATGRGKSLVFQIYAATEALRNNRASLFVYPLRALIADQAYHLNRALERFGITTTVLTGGSSPEEQAAVYRGLAEGTCDIVLTTPEFLHYHAADFPRDAFGFVVVDEVHHVSLSRAGYRETYANLGAEIARLGDPLVLALTATADAEVADGVSRGLGLEHTVLDRSQRDNMHVSDQRNIKKREEYLANLIARGEKTVIYVNSRQESVTLARLLRKRVPHIAPLIGFYNAGLSREERTRVEELFRSGTLCVLVATSAFGEGVNIPDIRHAVLYHMPFNQIEFNQTCGRVGRDGQRAIVHLLFGRTDREINERLLTNQTPDRDLMAQTYRCLRALQRNHGESFFSISLSDLADRASAGIGNLTVSAQAAECAIQVFSELGLLELRSNSVDGEAVRTVRVPRSESKVALTDSVRYQEGLDEQAIFHRFSEWALSANADEVRKLMIRPILPDDDSATYPFGKGGF